MARALTVKAIEAVKPDAEKRIEIPDAGLSGLYLVVQPSGTKSWALRYRIAGRPAKLTLGRWPVIGLAAARAAAAAAVQEVENGQDPALAKKNTKAARLEAQLSERDKVKTLVGQFERRHLSGLRTGASVRRHFDRFVLPGFCGSSSTPTTTPGALSAKAARWSRRTRTRPSANSLRAG